MSRPQIRVQGLNEFRRGLKEMDSNLPKALRLCLNEATDIIVDDAKPRVARRSGRAAGTMKARSTQSLARVTAGGPKAPYYPWLDFGGKIKRASRPFLKNGRYIYDAYFRNRDQFVDVMKSTITDLCKSAGIEAT